MLQNRWTKYANKKLCVKTTCSPIMMIRMMVTMIPMMIIIRRFFHQYFLFSFPALCSNWAAPCWRTSALLSSSDSLLSRSRTLSTFTFMILTTSSTFDCVSCNLFGMWEFRESPASPSLEYPPPSIFDLQTFVYEFCVNHQIVLNYLIIWFRIKNLVYFFY